MIWGIAVWATLLTATGAGTSLGTAAASPQAPVARARIELGARSTGGCGSAPDLSARIAARSPRIQLVDQPGAVGVQATFITGRSGTVAAELVMVDSGTPRPPRRFVARSCAEAADALALMVAVALDPVWVSEHATLGASPSDGAAAAGPSSDERIPNEKVRPLPPASVLAATAEPQHAGAPSRTAMTGLLAAQSLWGPVPSFMPGAVGYVVAAWDRDGVLSPALAVGASYAWRANHEEPGGKASFSLLAGSADACLLRAHAARVEVRACAAMTVGRLVASGSDTDNPARVARPFVVAGAASMVTVPLGPRFVLSARLGLGMTWPRSSYELGTTTFYTSSRLTTAASLGCGVRFW